MTLRDILQKMVDDKNSAKLSNGNGATDASTLLETLSKPMLATKAHMQPGLYIAEINPDGYLGRVLLRFERN
jgi:hypothetical protein